MDLLEKYSSEIDYTSIKAIRPKDDLNSKNWINYYSLIKSLPKESKSKLIDNDKIVEIKCNENQDTLKDIHNLVKELIPWRKGPFKINDELIDSEWQCWQKWKRIEPYLGEIKDFKISDIGSGNGYFMYQLAKKNPELVIGIEKSELPYQQFCFINKLAHVENLQMELASSDSLIHYKSFFNLCLCMGVLYHSRNPLEVLFNIKHSLAKGGKVLIETIIWPGDDDFCFFNPDRYSRMKNVFFIPTTTALVSWLKKTGFKEIEIHRVDKTTTNEQRKTKYSPFFSLEDQLKEGNHELTIEGYPAPSRVILTAINT